MSQMIDPSRNQAGSSLEAGQECQAYRGGSPGAREGGSSIAPRVREDPDAFRPRRGQAREGGRRACRGLPGLSRRVLTMITPLEAKKREGWRCPGGPSARQALSDPQWPAPDPSSGLPGPVLPPRSRRRRSQPGVRPRELCRSPHLPVPGTCLSSDASTRPPPAE